MTRLTLIRRWNSAKACEGELLLDGVHQCWTLEDRARGLHAEMPLEQLHALKIFGETAIPTGHYRVELYASPKHGPDTLQLVAVPAFDYVQIHVANRAEELLGCIAVGERRTEIDDDWIAASGPALGSLKAAVVPRIKAGGECWLDIVEVFA